MAGRPNVTGMKIGVPSYHRGLVRPPAYLSATRCLGGRSVPHRQCDAARHRPRLRTQGPAGPTSRPGPGTCCDRLRRSGASVFGYREGALHAGAHQKGAGPEMGARKKPEEQPSETASAHNIRADTQAAAAGGEPGATMSIVMGVGERGRRHEVSILIACGTGDARCWGCWPADSDVEGSAV